MGNKFLNIDNMDPKQGLPSYPSNFFGLAIIDPPYGLKEARGKNASRNKGFGKPGSKSKRITYAVDYGSKDWDDKPESLYFFKELQRVSRNQIIWGANHFIENIPNANSSCWIIWDKDNGSNDFADCEIAWTSFKTAVRKAKFRWNGLLQQDMKHKEKRIHPTQKPVKLYQWILLNYAKKGDVILDTHVGSASSLIACESMGFNYHGFEIDKEYYDAARKRMAAGIQSIIL